MKKIIILLFLIFTSTTLLSQVNSFWNPDYLYKPEEIKFRPNIPYMNTFSVVLQRSDMAWGFRYDRQFKNVKHGVYASYAKGNYYWNDSNSWIKDHNRYSGGFTWTFMQDPSEPIFGLFSVGLVYHRFGEQVGTDDLTQFDPKALDPISFELGVGNQFNRFSMRIRLDPIKWEVSLDTGFALNLVKKHREFPY